jgi:predicted nucleotidyltransferase
MDPLQHLNSRERDCLQRFFALLRERLGAALVEVWLFGSAARGDMWPDRSPMHSDIDLLILTTAHPPKELCESLVDETYPFFLECGRQISPSVTTVDEFREPPNERLRDVYARVRSEGAVVFRPDF